MLECNTNYNSFSHICEDGVCCITISNHEDWFGVLPKLASSILAGWGVVKAIGLFLIYYSNSEVKLDDDTHKCTCPCAKTDNESGGRATNIEPVNEEEF